MLKKLKKTNKKGIITFILFILTNMDVGSYFWAHLTQILSQIPPFLQITIKGVEEYEDEK